jgi:hypothetical protein
MRGSETRPIIGPSKVTRPFRQRANIKFTNVNDSMTAEKLLTELAKLVTTTSRESQPAILRALDVCVSTLNARIALPRAAHWFLHVAKPSPREEDPPPPLTAAAIAELEALVPRFVVLFSEQRHGSLCGNTGAEWAHAALELLPEPPDEARLARDLELLIAEVIATKSTYQRQSSDLCSDAFYRNSHSRSALLHLRFTYECPNSIEGHSYTLLEVQNVCNYEVFHYWPALDGEDYNLFDASGVKEICDRLGLHHVGPIEFASFLMTLACATADEAESWAYGGDSWGGQKGKQHEDSLRYMLKKYPHLLEVDEDDEE